MVTLATLVGVVCSISVSAVSFTSLQKPHNIERPVRTKKKTQGVPGVQNYSRFQNYLTGVQLGRLQKKSNQLKAQLRSQDALKVRLIAEKESLEEQVRTGKIAIEAEVKAAQEKADAEHNRTLKLQDELTEAQNERERRLQPVNARLDKQREREATLQEMQSQTIPSLGVNISALEKERDDLQKTRESLANELSEVASKTDTLMKDRDSAYGKFHPVDVRFSDQVDQNNELMKKNAGLRHELDTLVANKESLEKQIADARQRNRDLTAQIPMTENNLADVRNGMNLAQQKLLDLTGEQERLKANSTSMKETIRQYVLDTARLNNESIHLRAQLRDAMPQITHLNAENSKKQLEIANIEKQINNSTDTTMHENAAIINIMETGIEDLRGFLNSATEWVSQELDKINQTKI